MRWWTLRWWAESRWPSPYAPRGLVTAEWLAMREAWSARSCWTSRRGCSPTRPRCGRWRRNTASVPSCDQQSEAYSHVMVWRRRSGRLCCTKANLQQEKSQCGSSVLLAKEVPRIRVFWHQTPRCCVTETWCVHLPGDSWRRKWYVPTKLREFTYPTIRRHMPEDRNPHKHTQIYENDCNLLLTVLVTWYKVMNNCNNDNATAATKGKVHSRTGHEGAEWK